MFVPAVALYFYLLIFSGGNAVAESARRSAPRTTAYTRTLLDDADEAAFKATTNLETGVDIQAWHTNLDWLSTNLNSFWKTQLALTTLTDGGVLLGSGTGAITAMDVLTDGQFIVGDGTTDPVAESGATLRTSIGGVGSWYQAWNDNLDDIAALPPDIGSQITGDGTYWQVQAKNYLDILDYGAIADDGLDDGPAIQSAIGYVSGLATARPEIVFRSGVYDIDTSIILPSGISFRGAGFGSSNYAYLDYGTKLQSDSNDIFVADTGVYAKNLQFRNMIFYSLAGGGKIFDLDTNNTDLHVENWKFTDCGFTQSNTDQEIIKSPSDSTVNTGGWFYNIKFDRVSWNYPAGTTVPMFNITSAVINNINFSNFRSTKAAVDQNDGEFAILIDRSASGNVNNCSFRDGVLQQPLGGFIDIRAAKNCTFENLQVYDATENYGNPGFYIGKSTGGTELQSIELINVNSASGTEAIPDMQVSLSNSATPNIRLRGCWLSYADLGASFRRVSIEGGSVNLTEDSALAFQYPGQYDFVSTNGVLRSGDGEGSKGIVNSEFTTTINEWTGGSVTIAYSAGSMTMTNSSGEYNNVTGAMRNQSDESEIYRVVLKMSAVRTFPVSALRIYKTSSTWETVANTTSEQTFYTTLRSGSEIIFRIRTGTDVDLDYIRVYHAGLADTVSYSGLLEGTLANTGPANLVYSNGGELIGMSEVHIGTTRGYMPVYGPPTTDSLLTSIELGHATENTLSASGGKLSVEGEQVASGTATDGSILVGDGTDWQVQSKIVIDVRDYTGVDLTGASDSSDGIILAIADAVSATQSGYDGIYGGYTPYVGTQVEVHFPPGVYTISKALTADTAQQINYLKFVGDNAILVCADSNVVVFGGIGYMVDFEGITFRGGGTAISIKTNNTDTTVITIKDCEFHKQDVASISTDNNSASTLLLIDDCKFYQGDDTATSGYVGYFETGDSITISNCWITCATDAAFYNGTGYLKIIDSVGVPQDDIIASGGTWVENHGALTLQRFRMGGENGGAWSAVKNYADIDAAIPVIPLFVDIKDCQIYPKTYLIAFYKLPNRISISGARGLSSSTLKGLYVDPAIDMDDCISFQAYGKISIDNSNSHYTSIRNVFDATDPNQILVSKLFLSKLARDDESWLLDADVLSESDIAGSTAQQGGDGWSAGAISGYTLSTFTRADDEYGVAGLVGTASTGLCGGFASTDTFLTEANLTSGEIYTLEWQLTSTSDAPAEVSVYCGGAEQRWYNIRGKKTIRIPFLYTNDDGAASTVSDKLRLEFRQVESGDVFRMGRILLLRGVQTNGRDSLYLKDTTAPTGYTAGAVLDLGYQVNDKCVNITPASTGILGWVCTTAGNPGTWTPYGYTGTATGTGAPVLNTAPQISTIELGHDTDTTLSRIEAGVLGVEAHVRSTTSTYVRLHHVGLYGASPGASGATFVPPDANRTGGWRLNTATEYVYGESVVHGDWDGATDLALEVHFTINTDNTGGAGTDTCDGVVEFYYKGNGEDECKRQTVEGAKVIGAASQYTQFSIDIPLNWDLADNVVQAGDIIGLRFNLETDTSEVDDVTITNISLRYSTSHLGMEDGDF